MKNIGYGCGEKVLRVFGLIPNHWLTAKKGDTYYESRYILPIRFQIVTKSISPGRPKKREETRIEKERERMDRFSPTNYLDEVVVSCVRSRQASRISVC